MRPTHCHQIDHVLADKNARRFINVIKINPTADCFTDDKLLTCRCHIVVKKKRRGTRPPPKLDTTVSATRKEKLERFLDEQLQDCEESWEDLKEVLQNAGKHVFGKKKRRSEDWFEDQDETIQSLLKDKKLRGDRTALREEIRKLKNKWFHQKRMKRRSIQESRTTESFMQPSTLSMARNHRTSTCMSKEWRTSLICRGHQGEVG